MSLPDVWFWLAALLLAMYTVLDGFDLGVGIVQPWVAKTPAERRLLATSIGPVWDGNEVWLLAAGGTMVFAFPKLYAVGVSGFYLPVTILLWLLGFRALGLEMRHHLDHPLWEQAWSALFCWSSTFVALFLSIALGNVVRGVSFGEDGRFFAPLWTDFRVGENTGILDLYTVSIGLYGVSALALHGATWIAARTAGPPAERAARLVSRLYWVVLALALVTGAATFAVQPELAANLKTRAWGVVFPLAVAVTLGLFKWCEGKRLYRRAFHASSAFLLSAVAGAGYGIFPYVLPARVAERGLTAEAASSSHYALSVGFLWWIPGMLLASAYFVALYRRLPDKIEVDSEH